MANHSHSSSGGGGFRVDLDMTDFTQEISEGIQLAPWRLSAAGFLYAKIPVYRYGGMPGSGICCFNAKNMRIFADTDSSCLAELLPQHSKRFSFHP